MLIVAPEPVWKFVGAAGVASFTVMVGWERLFEVALDGCGELASVMSPPEGCEEQATSNVKVVTAMASKNRRTLAIQVICQRKYTGVLVLVGCRPAAPLASS
jgi:hypothetical protein